MTFYSNAAEKRTGLIESQLCDSANSKPISNVKSSNRQTSASEYVLLYSTGASIRIRFDGRSCRLTRHCCIVTSWSKFCAMEIEGDSVLQCIHLGNLFNEDDSDEPASARFDCNDNVETETNFICDHLRPSSPALLYLLNLLERKGYDEREILLAIRKHLRRLERELEQQLKLIISAKLVTRISIFKKLQRANDYILSNFETVAKISEIAVASCISQSVLLKYYPLVHGITPRQHIINLRLEYAKELLAETDVELGSIIIMIGFHNKSSFIRLFKSRFGVTPGKHRAMGQTGKRASGQWGESGNRAIGQSGNEKQFLVEQLK